MVARSIPGRSPILQSAGGAGKLRIVPALYSLATGKVTLLG